MAQPSSRLFGYLLFGLNFLVMMDYLSMVPLVIDIAKSTGLPSGHTGLLLSTYPIAAAFSSFFTSPFSDRLGRKRLLLILLSCFALSSLGVALSTSVVQIFVFRILSGIFGGPILPNSFAFAGDLFQDTQRSKAISNLSLSFSAASILGVPLGAWIGVAFGWQWTYGSISLFALCGLLWFLQLPNPTPGAQGTVGKQYKELLQLWQQPSCRHAFYIQFFMIVGLFGVVPNLAVWLSTNYGYGANQIAFCYMQGGIGAVVGNRIASYLLRHNIRRGLISGGSAIMALFIGLGCLELFPNPPIGLFFAGIMFGGSLRVPVHQLNLAELLPTQYRGRLMSMNMIVSHLSMGIGGLWSSPILQLTDKRLTGMPKIALVAMLLLGLVPIAVAAFERSREKSVVH